MFEFLFLFFLNHHRFIRCSCSSLPACFLQWEMRGRGADQSEPRLCLRARFCLSEPHPSVESQRKAVWPFSLGDTVPEVRGGGSQCGGAGAGNHL